MAWQRELPPLGVPWVNEHGYLVTRITDAAAQGLPWIAAEYSTVCAFSGGCMAEDVKPVESDDDQYELVDDLKPGNEVRWMVRGDGITMDLYDITADGWKRIDYTGMEDKRFQFRPYQGGLRMYRKR